MANFTLEIYDKLHPENTVDISFPEELVDALEELNTTGYTKKENYWGLLLNNLIEWDGSYSSTWEITSFGNLILDLEKLNHG